jgi:uncharacterized membrane protein YfcA
MRRRAAERRRRGWYDVKACARVVAARRGKVICAAMHSNTLLLVAAPLTGVAAGFINTLAGSGSLLTLPMLIFLGLPANSANATNRVGVLLQNIVAVWTFRKHGALDAAGTLPISLAAVAGSLLGAALAVNLDEALLRRIIGALMLVMLVVMLVKPERWLAAAGPRRPLWIEMPLFFALGVYGGFIQAGIGIFLLAALVLGAGFNLVTANGVKNLIVLIVTAVALAIFMWHGQIEWMLGLTLGAGQAVGAWLAARLAVKRGAEFVRWVVIVVVLFSAVALFGGLGS